MPFPYDVRYSQFKYQKTPSWSNVYWFDFGVVRSGQDRTIVDPHPVVVVSDTASTQLDTVLIVPLTGAEHKTPGYAFHVLVTRQECPSLDKDSIVKVDQIYCVSPKDLPDQYYLTTFSKAVMKRIYAQMLRALNAQVFLP